MILQFYKDGAIHREGNEYLYVVNKEIKGTFKSVEELVNAQKESKESNGEKATEVQPIVSNKTTKRSTRTRTPSTGTKKKLAKKASDKKDK